METIESKYDQQARDAGVYIVCSCGFDSIPNDMGALMVQKSFNGDLAYVDSYVTLHGSNVSLMCFKIILLHSQSHACQGSILI